MKSPTSKQKYSIFYQWEHQNRPHTDNKCRELLVRHTKTDSDISSCKIIKVVRDWSPVCKSCSIVMWKKPLDNELANYTVPSPKRNLCLSCYEKQRNEIISH